MKIGNIIISKGRKAKIGPVHTRDITVSDVWQCFRPKPGTEYRYLGYAYYYPNADGSIPPTEQRLREFFQQVERVARPWWCPRFVLRLLDLFGNDGSIVRLRSWRLHKLFNRITKGIRITDTKWKWDTFRIYGFFTRELEELADQTCTDIERIENENNSTKRYSHKA